MITALLLGRKGSVGFPGKNLHHILGKPLAWYPINAAKKSKLIDKIFLSTDDKALMELGKETSIEVIERPDYLCTKEALGEDAYVHGYYEICKRISQKPEFMVLLFCNAATLTPELIDEGIVALRNNSSYDSAVTVSKYNMWSPLRARKIDNQGLLKPFIPFKHFNSKKMNCDRDSQGDAWFADVSVSVVRPENLENIETGLLPQKWMGKRIFPLFNEAGCDIDYEWMIPQVEWYLKNKAGY